MKKNNLLVFLVNIFKYKFFYFDTKYFGDYDLNSPTTLSQQIKKNKKVIIYGFGPYGEEYFLKFFDLYRIIGIYDRNFEQMDKYIESPEVICEKNFDYVIVTVMNKRARNSVVNFLLEKGISENKIVFIESNDKSSI